MLCWVAAVMIIVSFVLSKNDPNAKAPAAG
jgi:hypothetical protein